ncbi:MAG: BatD family protein [Kiritimatiellae bacterium]|nr:BatD family protein [Kiritimatiellia bacterium]
MFGVLLVCAIKLAGVEGEGLRSRAFFDANNVKVGDPMVLTVDFIGEADFKDLHPPALSRAVSRGDWKLDDASAKTDTFRDARRLVYRVRPMREGVLWFPSLEFEYTGRDGGCRTVRANAIPVHAKGGAQVVVDEMGEEENAMPKPPGLVREIPGGVSDDVLFSWRRACAQPSAEAFRRFDFAEARLNEATCLLRDGNWSAALKIYSALEWRIGQTPEIERGMIAALALKHDDPAVELPVWRQVLRPVLRRAWPGRVVIVLGSFAALAVLFWLLGRGIRAVAAVAVAAGFTLAAPAQDIFRQMEEHMERMQRQMQQSMGGFRFSVGGRREPVKIRASVRTEPEKLQVGDVFDFIISLEAPRTVSIGQVRISVSQDFGLTFTGRAENLTDGVSRNPSNVVKRLALPARYDVPFKGPVVFTVDGMVSGRESGGGFSFSYSDSFQSKTDPVDIDVKPLPASGQPDGFAGVISEGLRIHETCDIMRVETNDVVTVTYRMFPNGYVPDDFLPEGAAFEWVRQQNREGRTAEIEYRRYFVADGAPATPVLKVPYYDPRSKKYKTARTGGTPLIYKPSSAHR